MKPKQTDRITLLTREQLAEKLGISTWTVWSWVKKGILPKPIPLGPAKMHRWRAIDIEIWLDRSKKARKH